MSTYSIYIYFVLIAVATTAVVSVFFQLVLPTNLPRKAHARKIWTVVVFFLGWMLIASGFFVYWTVEVYKISTALLHGMGMGFILAMVLVGSYQAKGTMSGQTIFFGGMSILAVAGAVVIVFAANFYFNQKDWKFDFNKDKLESLDDETVKVLKNLKSKIEVIAFLYKEEKEQEQLFLSFFEKYRAVNRQKFDVRVINPVDSPTLAECYEVKGDLGGQLRNRIVLSRDGACSTQKGRTSFSGKKVVIDNQLSEKEVTNKLIRLTRERQKQVCFLRGRNQPSISSKNAFGYHEFNHQLKEKGFTTQEITLLTTENIPDTCDMIVHAVPEWITVVRQGGKQALERAVKLDDIEIDRIKAYLDKGGKMMLFLEPLADSGLSNLLEKQFGITWMPGTVIDFLANYEGIPYQPLGTSFSQEHPVTKDFKQDTRIPFRWATALKRSAAMPAGVVVTELVKSPRVQFMGMRNRNAPECCSFYVPDPMAQEFSQLLTNARRWKREEMLRRIITEKIVQQSIPGSQPGPFSYAMSAVKKGAKAKEETRIVVFADSSLASNMMMQIPFNRNLVFNSLAWMVQEKDLVHIVTKQRKPSNIELTTTQQTAIRLTSRYGIPLFFLFMIVMVMGIRRLK